MMTFVKGGLKVRTHGTPSGYNQGCRCDACADAGRAWWREYNIRRGRTKHASTGPRPQREERHCPFCGTMFLAPPSATKRFCSVQCSSAARRGRAHGTQSGYGGGCRCDACRAANTAHFHEQKRRRQARNPEVNPTLLHGRPRTYQNHGCTCDACRDAWRVLMREGSRRRAAERKTAHPEHNPSLPHGTLGCYSNWYCRCERCKQASAAHYQARKQRRIQGGD